MKAIIIAEAGVNHNGDQATALRLVAAAKSAGADYVKFQTFNADSLVTKSAAKAAYQMEATSKIESQYEMLRRLELSQDAHELLVKECQRLGIGFLSTAFDEASLDFLVSIGVSQVKIPSGEITNLPFLRHAARTGLPIILSTGMSTIGEVESAIDVLTRSGTPRDRVTVLHCTSQYPAPMAAVNLNAMNAIRCALKVRVGYSDHTLGTEVAIAAVALGAQVIEKHFTLDRGLPGPDHQASLEPDELKAMVSGIRNVEVALGDGVKRPVEIEYQNRSAIRRSIVASRVIRKGEVLSSSALTVKRPGVGISPMEWDDVVGRLARRDFDKDELIEL